MEIMNNYSPKFNPFGLENPYEVVYEFDVPSSGFLKIDFNKRDTSFILDYYWDTPYKKNGSIFFNSFKSNYFCNLHNLRMKKIHSYNKIIKCKEGIYLNKKSISLEDKNLNIYCSLFQDVGYIEICAKDFGKSF